MSINIANYKRPGVFLQEFPRDFRTIPAAVQTYQLVMGSSKRGPFNRPILINNQGDREAVYGKIDRNLEYKQSFFHRTIDVCLRTGPVQAINLMPFEEQDTANQISVSTSSMYNNASVDEEPIANFYNKTDFQERKEEELLYIANKDINTEDQKNILHFTNLGDRKITLFAFKSYIKGFDIPAADFYNGAQNIPTFMYPTDLISDYFIQIAAVMGNQTDYESLSVDLTQNAYFNKNGLRKDKFLQFINDPRVSLMGYQDVCLIPYFRDKTGRQFFVETTINSQTDTTGLFVAYDTTKLEDTDYPMGLVDLVGNALVEGQEMINFLSYNENILDRLLFETKYISESDGDGNLLNTGGIAGTDEAGSNTQFLPDRREIKASQELIYHQYAMTPQRSLETDLTNYTVVGLKTRLIYTRDYLAFTDSNADANPATEYLGSNAPATPNNRNHTYGIDIDLADSSSGAPITSGGDLVNMYSAPSSSTNPTLFAYSGLNLKKIEVVKFDEAIASDNKYCYYVVGNKKITFDQIINPNNIEDNYKPYLTVGPHKPNYRTDIELPVNPDNTFGGSVTPPYANGMGEQPSTGRIDLVLLNDQGHLTVLKGTEFTVGILTNSGYANPALTLTTAIPQIPDNHICLGFVTIGIKFNSDTTYNDPSYQTAQSLVHYFPVQVSTFGPVPDKNIHLKYNSDAERVLETQPNISLYGGLPMVATNGFTSSQLATVSAVLSGTPYLKYQEPIPADGDFFYYNKIKSIDVLFFNTKLTQLKPTIGNLLHNDTTPLTQVNNAYTVKGPSLLDVFGAVDETTLGCYYHNIMTSRKYANMKNRIVSNVSNAFVVAQKEEDFNKILNAGNTPATAYNNKYMQTAKSGFTPTFFDSTNTNNGKASLTLQDTIYTRTGKLTIYFRDVEQLFGTQKSTTQLSNDLSYYNVTPSYTGDVNNIPSEFLTTPIGLNSDLYSKYIDGFVNTKDYFYQALFASDEEFTLKFSSELDTDSNPTYRIYVDAIDPSLYGNFVNFEIYGGVLKSKYANTVLAYTQYGANDLYQDIIPQPGTKIYIKGSDLNDGFYTVKSLGYSVSNGTTYQYIEVSETVTNETNTKVVGQDPSIPPYTDDYFVRRIRMYSAEKVYLEFKLYNNNFEINYYSDQGLTSPLSRITPLTAFIGLEIFSLKENLKQTVDIKRLGAQSNQIIVDASRYSELFIGDYLEAYYDANSIEPDQMPKKLTRVLKKERLKDDVANGIINEMMITTDSKIKIYQIGSSLQTVFYKHIDNYATTLKGIFLDSIKIRPDLLPNGTEERQDALLDMFAEGSPIYNGLINKDKISYRYLVDTYGKGLTADSKQQYLDLLNSRQDATGFINMPSAQDFRKSIDPSFVNSDGSLNTEYIKIGADLSKNPTFQYSFGKGYGQTYVGYFFPQVKINDNGRPLMMPPAAHVANAYMKKFTATTNTVDVGSVIAGLDTGRIENILDLEMDFNYTDIENLNTMGANPLTYKMDQGFVIETNNTASVTPPSSLSNLHVREILIELESELRRMLLRYQQKYNTSDTRAEIKFRADAICKKYKDRGYIYDYVNIMDETNNTLEVIDAGIGVLDTFIEPVKAMGVLVNNVTILATGDIQAGRFTIV